MMELKLYASLGKTKTKTKVLGAGLPRILLLFCPGFKTQLFRAVSHTEDTRKICQFIRFEVVLVTKNLEKLQVRKKLSLYLN